MTDKDKIRNIIELFIAWNGETEAIDVANIDSAVEFIGSSLQPVSKNLENAALEYATHYDKNWSEVKDGYIAENEVEAFKAGAQCQKEHLWKPADGDDLPEIDREVVVLIKYNAQRNIHDEEYPTYRVGFGHRPKPDGWDGKDIDTNEVTHYTPKLYDKGGWNAPNIVYWLDARLPYEENKIIK